MCEHRLMSTQLSVADFPLTSKLTPANRPIGEITTLEWIVVTINTATKSRTILNPEFESLKYTLGRMVDNIRFFGKEKSQADLNVEAVLSWAYRLDLNLEFYSPMHAAGKIKIIDKWMKRNSNTPDAILFREFVSEIAQLSEAVTNLKPLVVKRQPKAADDPTKTYIAPMAKKEAGRKVIAVLTTLTNEIKAEFVAAVKRELVSDVTRAFELREDHKAYREFCMYNPHMNTLTWKCFEKTPQGMPVAWKETWEAELDKEAFDAGEFMQQQFLCKNAKKLAKIVELKDNLTECQQIGKPFVQAGGIRGEMALMFADGAAFNVHNTVKWNRSVHGKMFNQFPTTFHNVTIPGGAALDNPSEKRMIEVFAIAK